MNNQNLSERNIYKYPPDLKNWFDFCC